MEMFIWTILLATVLMICVTIVIVNYFSYRVRMEGRFREEAYQVLKREHESMVERAYDVLITLCDDNKTYTGKEIRNMVNRILYASNEE